MLAQLAWMSRQVVTKWREVEVMIIRRGEE
jgi:hypothetical protein